MVKMISLVEDSKGQGVGTGAGGAMMHFPANPTALCRFADKMALQLSLWH